MPSAAGFDRAVPYRRMPGSHDPRVRFIFEGTGPDELIGDQPNLQTTRGAAGYEIDRFDHELGTPATALLLVSSVGFSEHYHPMLDEILWSMPGRDGGAVFSVGSIAWRGGIAHDGYDNTVSRVTGNVLRRFAERPRGVSPNDEA